MKPAALLLGAVMTVAAIGCGARGGPNIQVQEPPTTGVCQHTCTPDPLPARVDCAAAEAPYELYQRQIGTFDEPNALNDSKGAIAATIYSYTDQSNRIESFGGQTWEPPTMEMGRCFNPTESHNHVLHVQGGPFLAWGGGIGQSMKDYSSKALPPGIGSLDCSTDTATICQGRDPIIPTTDPTNGNTIHPTLNLSEWEGISFWARRGPDSQIGLRVLAGDRYTDDDVSFLMFGNEQTKNLPRYCERVRECSCQNHMACVAAPATPDGQLKDQYSPCVNNALMGRPIPGTNMHVQPTYCGEPMELPSAEGGSGSNPQCNSCDRNRCNEAWPAYPATDPDAPADPAFADRPCLPFTYRNGVSSSFCFDPAKGEKPAEPDQQCGDHWTKTVALSNEWQFFAVPFNSMTQQGWAKHTTKLDLTNLTLIRFTWDGGWADFYLDDIRFYRHKK